MNQSAVSAFNYGWDILANVDEAMARLAEKAIICSAICPHCGALNTFPGLAAVDAFICQECGEGVDSSRLYPVQ